MDNSLQNIRDYNEQQSARNERDIKHAALIDSNTQTQQVIVEVMRGLVDFLDNNVSQTEVVNQLHEIGTPDAYKVVEAVNQLQQTLEHREQIDLSQITELLHAVLQETEKIPKSHNVIDIPDPIDNSEQLKSLETAIKAVETSIKAQKLTAEAPIVNVPETVVNVEKTDLTTLEKEQKQTRTDLVKAIKGIVIPKTDVKPIEKELKKLNKLFNEFVEYGTGSSGGGNSGVQSTLIRNNNSIAVVNPDGSTIGGGGSSSGKPSDLFALTQFDDSTDPAYEYYAYMDKDANWYIKRFNTATNLFKFTAPVATSFTTGWTGRAALTYVDYATAF